MDITPTHPDAQRATTFIVGLAVGLGLALFCAIIMATQPTTVIVTPAPTPAIAVDPYPSQGYPMPVQTLPAPEPMPYIQGDPTVPMPQMDPNNFDWTTAVTPEVLPDPTAGNSVCVDRTVDAYGNVTGESAYAC